MSVESAVRARLVGDAGVNAIVSGRVYQLVLPQKPTLPAVRVQLIDEPSDYHLRGPNGLHRARVQTDAYTTEAEGYSACVSLADAIDDALSGDIFSDGNSPSVNVVGCFRESRRTVYEPGELRLVRIMQDYTVWHELTN
jgi:hypothetical protein